MSTCHHPRYRENWPSWIWHISGESISRTSRREDSADHFPHGQMKRERERYRVVGNDGVGNVKKTRPSLSRLVSARVPWHSDNIQPWEHPMSRLSNVPCHVIFKESPMRQVRVHYVCSKQRSTVLRKKLGTGGHASNPACTSITSFFFFHPLF